MSIRRFFSQIWIRLFAFNILLVFLPVAGILFLGSFEHQLLRAQERTMVQEGRLLAAALSARSGLSVSSAREILKHLGQRHETRLRVIGPEGKLLADSASLGPMREPADSESASRTENKESWLYRLGSLPFRLLHRFRAPAKPGGGDSYDGQDRILGPEIRAAFLGRYGAATRVVHGNRPTVRLYSAIPVKTRQGVEGVVLVSQSTFRIFQILYELRLGVFKVFLASLAAALLLSFQMGMTIVGPLTRLKDRAEALLDRRGRLRGNFSAGTRHDEIGDLQRALAVLTGRLEKNLRAMETFAADLSHEFKNPLAAIRVATEMAQESGTTDERKKLLSMVQTEVRRMEGLLSEVREISRIDISMGEDDREVFDIRELLRGVIESFEMRLGPEGPSLVLETESIGFNAEVSPDHLVQVMEKILENAVSFSPPGGSIRMRLVREEGWIILSVEDEGPGIAEGDFEKIFDRFYTTRRDEEGEHNGLGLALSRAIIEAHGGKIRALSGEEGGTVIEVKLPSID